MVLLYYPLINYPDLESGFILGFFATLRAALYGEQKKEAKFHQKKSKKSRKRKKIRNKQKLGILARVCEVGAEQFLSPIPTEG